MKIVVIGGTGLIGSKLVNKLREHGHEAVAAAPNTAVNIGCVPNRNSCITTRNCEVPTKTYDVLNSVD